MVAEGRTRRRAASSTSRKQPSAAHYVGYVDDEESVESILKKFEELDNFTAQLKAQKCVNGCDLEEWCLRRSCFPR